MLDLAPSLHMQRSTGDAFVHFNQSGGISRLADLGQKGSAKAMLPRVFGRCPEVVFMNTSGGLTGDDRLRFSLQLGEGTHICATTQTAERVYASTGAPAFVNVQADIGPSARLDWLPQETIVFEHGHLQRKTDLNLAEGATALMVESLVLGRAAMGEKPAFARITDHRLVRRAGRVFWTETLRLDRESLALAAGPALLGGATAMAVIAYIANGAQDSTAKLQAVPLYQGAHMAVSGWNGRCLIRITATDAWPLRQQIIRVVSLLRAAPMPRVWQC